MSDAIFRVKAPDGSIMRIKAPEDAREDEIQSFAEKQYLAEQKRSKFVEELPKELFQSSHPTAQMLIGASKPFAGVAQYAGFNQPANFLNALTKRFEEEGKSPTVASGLDMAGQMMSPLPIKGGKMVEGALSKVAPKVAESNLVRGAIQGGTQEAFNPVDTDGTYKDFIEKKLGNVAEASVVGGGLGKVAQAVMNPKVSQQVQKLKDLGVNMFTPGQLASEIPIVGKALQKMEAQSTSIPVLGDIVRNQLNNTNKQFNRGLANKVLENMGEKLPKEVPAGAPMVDYLNKRIEGAYDEITPKLGFKNIIYPSQKTSTIKQFMDFARERAKELPEQEANQFISEFKRTFIDNLDPALAMTGEQFRKAERQLGNMAYNYIRNPDKFSIGVALRDLQSEIRNELAYQNPHLAKKLRGIHDAFIDHLPLERAASKLGAKERVFSPSQFESAVQAESKGKGKFASGQSRFYDESQAGVNVLGPTVPDSGTTGRALTAGAIASAPLHFKATIAPLLATSAIYNPIASKFLSGIATGTRPQAVQKAQPMVSNMLSRSVGLPDYQKEE